VGSCEDREERLRRHNAGDTKATKHGIPWSLIHSEALSTRGEATAGDAINKTGRGRDELDSFL
jgi:putative endonuclease